MPTTRTIRIKLATEKQQKGQQHMVYGFKIIKYFFWVPSGGSIKVGVGKGGTAGKFAKITKLVEMAQMAHLGLFVVFSVWLIEFHKILLQNAQLACNTNFHSSKRKYRFLFQLGILEIFFCIEKLWEILENF